MNPMEYTDLGTAPISEALPAGIDLATEPLYEQLSLEIKKLSSPTAEGGIDWQAIQNLAAEILQTRSKHILVACCLSVAWQHTGGWRGFAQGVRVVRDLLLTYWDQCFPEKKRMRGRRNALVWWKEQIDKLIEAGTGEQWDHEARQALLDDFEEIDRFLGEQLEDSPLFRPTIQALGTLIAEAAIPEPQQDPEPVAPETPAVPATATEPRPPAQPLASGPRHEAPIASDSATPEKNLARGSEFLRVAATQLLQNDPFHPLAFRLNRIVAWFPVDSLPPASDGTTLVPPPDDQVVSLVRSLEESGNWPALLQTAEAQLRQHLFWLDLNRYVAEALDRLGKELASEGVAHETRLLVRRLPSIEKLSFNDGTPFADQATRAWLKEFRITKGTDGTVVPDEAQGERGGIAAKLAAAWALAKDGKLTEALNELRHGLRTAGGGREQLLWTAEICRLLCRQQQAALAVPFAESLVAQLDRHGLEQWEPELAEETLEVVYQALRLQESNEQASARMNEVLHRLALLNPARALDVK